MNYEAPNNFYSKFFSKFSEIDSLAISDWSKTHVLGYFCKKYYDKYNKLYSFKFNTPQPSKSFEIFQINKLYISLSSDPKVLKSYIDWIFETKVNRAKRQLTSISFLTTEQDLYAFKNKYLSGTLNEMVIDRTTKLPEEVKSICNIDNYGDLAFFLSVESEECVELKKKLVELKFDLGSLSKVR